MMLTVVATFLSSGLSLNILILLLKEHNHGTDSGRNNTKYFKSSRGMREV